MSSAATARWISAAVQLVALLAIDALALLFLAWLLSSFTLDTVWQALGMAAAIAVLNFAIRPLLIYVALPLVVLSGGLLSLVITGLTVWLAAQFVDGVEVSSIWVGILITVGLVAIGIVLSSLLNVDSDGRFTRGALRRLAHRGLDEEAIQQPGVVFLEIDGLSAPVFERASAAGMVPVMTRWLNDGSHHLDEWECDLSAQTGACQAGLLHGNNSDMPAFRWYDKGESHLWVSNHPEDAGRIEAHISDGNGLLANGGVALGNMFSGDATTPLFTMSQLSKLRSTSREYFPFFADPARYSRTLILAVVDIFRGWRHARAQRKRDERPRVPRGGIYPLVRAMTTVVLRDLSSELLIAKMNQGVPAIYVTHLAYDEVAHHSGVERRETLEVLKRLDATFAKVEKAEKLAARDYHLVVLADHGQSQGATFKQRQGQTLAELIEELIGQDVAEVDAGDEGLGHLSAFVTDATDERAIGGAAIKEAVQRQAADEVEAEADDQAPVVLPSGNLAVVYFPGPEGRLTAEQIEARHPGLVDALASNPNIGFVMVHSATTGPIAIGADGRHDLRTGHLVGQDPLAPFGPNAARHLLRSDGFSNAPDLLINSLYDPETGEVAAFEELVGCHGGLGGDQTRPVFLHPVALDMPEEKIVGAETAHRVLKSWVPDR